MNYVIYSKNIEKTELFKRNIYIGERAIIGENVIIENSVCLEGDCIIGDNCKIASFSVLNNAILGSGVTVQSSKIDNSFIGENSTVGPFAHIRLNSKIGKNNRIGNFVEIKNSETGDYCKIAHLSYVGDAKLGKNCNIGCGVVFCNYNGEIKQHCTLGENVFVGSNVNLIAPLIIEDNAYIAAGSTINKNISKDEFSIARARQENKKNFKNPYLNAKK